MREKIHPNWYPDAKITCSCGAVWTVGASIKEQRTDVCAKCHPFFTGEQRIVDTEGQVDRFMRRLQARTEVRGTDERRRGAFPATDLPVVRLGLGKRMEKLLTDAGLVNVGTVLDRFTASGDESFADIKGLGLKELADLKRSLRTHGFTLPGDQVPADVEATAAA